MSLLVLLALGIAASPSTSASGVPMPRFSWDTLPVIFHSSNSTAPNGMYSPEALKVLAKYSVVTIEKYQGSGGFFPNSHEINMQGGYSVLSSLMFPKV